MEKEKMAMAAIATLAALGGELELTQVPAQSNNHQPINGHICGHDMVKGANKRPQRNQKCPCGSDLKSKKCCKK